MCLCLFAINQHDKYPFILLANRDEFRKRPSVKAGFWTDQPQILAGIDLQQMGTWLGITKTGRLAFLTNHRNMETLKQDAPSRGALVSNFLSSEMEADHYLKNINHPESFNGFNLIVGQPNALFYYSNVEQKVHQIDDGIHGLSNALLNSFWPKVDTGKKQLQEAIEADTLVNGDLFGILANDEIPTDDQLPETGVGLEFERILSSRFINTPEYGTVCSTVIKIDRKQNCHFEERTFNAQGQESDRAAYHFQLKL
jgi:uncharacterized protein with NRDE domain